MEKYIDYIDFIENTLTERLDTQIAYNEIQKIRTKYYGSSNNQVNINMAKYRDTKNYTDYCKRRKAGSNTSSHIGRTVRWRECPPIRSPAPVATRVRAPPSPRLR